MEEGIELKLSLSYTHELNSGSERARQEVIDKALVIWLLISLLEMLWLEIALAVMYLYNISLLYSHEWSSLNEVLDS